MRRCYVVYMLLFIFIMYRAGRYVYLYATKLAAGLTHASHSTWRHRCYSISDFTYLFMWQRSENRILFGHYVSLIYMHQTSKLASRKEWTLLLFIKCFIRKYEYNFSEFCCEIHCIVCTAYANPTMPRQVKWDDTVKVQHT